MAIAKRWLLLGVFVNLSLLAYFKYANFFIVGARLNLTTCAR